MSFVLAIAGFPLLLALMATGHGLLAERIYGRRLPAALVPVIGFAALIVLAEFTTWPGALAPATPWLLLAIALAGYALAWRQGVRERWQARRSGWWLAPAAAIITYITVASPEIAAGRLTFPAYLVDTTGAVQMMGADWLLHHGRDFSALAQSPGYGMMLSAYFGHGYPYGGQAILGAVGELSGQSLVWLYAPLQAMELAFSALVLLYLAGQAGLSRLYAAVTGWIAAVPALVFAYALMGSIKELTALPLLLLMGAMIVLARSCARQGLRGALPFALAAVGTLSAVGLAGSGWVLAFGLAALAFASGPGALGRRLRRFATYGVGLAGVGALLALPILMEFSANLSQAEAVQNTNAAAVADPGNLLRPLPIIQTFGVWLGESHRFDPRYPMTTYLLIGVVAVAFALGCAWLLRRRAFATLAFLALSLVVWEFLRRRGTEWTDAKTLMLLSPVIVFTALIGAFTLSRRRRMESALLAGVIALGVLASDALLYHGTGLAPSQRFVELEAVGERFAGQGPALLSDFDEYALYLLRRSRPTGAGFADSPGLVTGGGGAPAYGHSYDTDQLDQTVLQRYPLLVMSRSPEWSRPPSNYSLAWRGASYEVWRRAGAAPLRHIGLDGAVEQPTGVISCPTLRTLAREAERAHAELRIAERPENVTADLSKSLHSATIGELGSPDGIAELVFYTPGHAEASVKVPAAGRYRLWLGGTVDRPLHVFVDGREAGAPSEILGGDRTMYPVATLSLGAGTHRILLVRGGGDLRPGDAGSTILQGIVLQPLAAQQDSLRMLAPSAWRSLCGHRMDWLEFT